MAAGKEGRLHGNTGVAVCGYKNRGSGERGEKREKGRGQTALRDRRIGGMIGKGLNVEFDILVDQTQMHFVGNCYVMTAARLVRVKGEEEQEREGNAN